MRMAVSTCVSARGWWTDGEVAHTAAICPPKYPRTCPTIWCVCVCVCACVCVRVWWGDGGQLGTNERGKREILTFRNPSVTFPPPHRIPHVLGIFDHRFGPIFWVITSPAADVTQHQSFLVSTQKNPGALRVWWWWWWCCCCWWRCLCCCWWWCWGWCICGLSCTCAFVVCRCAGVPVMVMVCRCDGDRDGVWRWCVGV